MPEHGTKPRSGASEIYDAAGAASYAASYHRLDFRASDILCMSAAGLVLSRSHGDSANAGFSAREIAEFGVLFDWVPNSADTYNLLSGVDRRFAFDPSAGTPKAGIILLTVSPDLQLAIQAQAFRAYEVQLFLLAYRGVLATGPATEDRVPDAGAVVFRSETEDVAKAAMATWKQVVSLGDTLTEDDRRTTASIYGVKSRLASLITSVTRTMAPRGHLVCDLMSGSGIITRKLARTHRVLSNDANAYGAVFTGADPQSVRDAIEAGLIPRLRDRIDENIDGLRQLVAPFLKQEASLLSSASNPATILAYERFIQEVPAFFGPDLGPEVLRVSPPTPQTILEGLITERRRHSAQFPFVLATSYWANVHFGLRQCVVIDSIRYAIAQESDPAVRNTLLAALLQAALLRASGPHFAQPLRPKGTGQYRALIEKRSKPIDAEFFAILSSHAKLPAPAFPSLGTLRGDWRKALSVFGGMLAKTGSRGVVYVDPPYTSVQYSRYYHVLNVLADYDYPECAGPGRCPIRSYRFSSRFEFKLPPVVREMKDLVKACAGQNLDLILSYSRSGAMSASDLMDILEANYAIVRVFQMAVRHHTQGRTASRDRMETTEYAFVANRSLTANT